LASALKFDLLTYNVTITSKTALPKTISQDGDRLVIQQVFIIGRKYTAHERLDSKDAKKVIRNNIDGMQFRCSVFIWYLCAASGTRDKTPKATGLVFQCKVFG
jgi:hypothetical protein